MQKFLIIIFKRRSKNNIEHIVIIIEIVFTDDGSKCPKRREEKVTWIS